MPRLPRLHVPGGFYHVTLRGNHRAAIFRSRHDYRQLDDIVEEVLDRFGARLHGYCWMPNHLHMALQIADDPLGHIMRRIASRYARTFQARLDTTGHLFERRYHARLVDTDSYLLVLLRYIHLNPVRAALVADPAAYEWSSHRDYLGLRSRVWITTSFMLAMLHRDEPRARAAYARFVDASATARAPTCSAADPRVLGDAAFLARLGSDVQRPRPQRTLQDLVDYFCRRYAVQPEELISPRRWRKHVQIRALIAHAAIACRVVPLQAVACYFGRDESAIRRAVDRLRTQVGAGALKEIVEDAVKSAE